jgi:hypothetical protein
MKTPIELTTPDGPKSVAVRDLYRLPISLNSGRKAARNRQRLVESSRPGGFSLLQRVRAAPGMKKDGSV